MTIGFSERTLWAQINHAYEEIESEVQWLNHYIAIGEVECVEDCIRNIEESCQGIKANLEYLKGEAL